MARREDQRKRCWCVDSSVRIAGEMVAALLLLLASAWVPRICLPPLLHPSRSFSPLALETGEQQEQRQLRPSAEGRTRQKRLVPMTNQPMLFWLDEIFDTPEERAEREARKRANVRAWGRYLSGNGPDPKTLPENWYESEDAAADAEKAGETAGVNTLSLGLSPVVTIIGVPILMAVAAIAGNQLAK